MGGWLTRASRFRLKAGHNVKPDRLLQKGTDQRICLVLRNPADHLVSAFGSRKRKGKPAHHVPWNSVEAVVFAFFESANELAEALYSKDRKVRAVARMALKNMNHLARNYTYYFKDTDKLGLIEDRLEFVCHLKDLNSRLPEFLGRYGVSPKQYAAAFAVEHSAGSTPEPLSETAQTNLHRFWATEFALYDALCKLER